MGGEHGEDWDVFFFYRSNRVRVCIVIGLTVYIGPDDEHFYYTQNVSDITFPILFMSMSLLLQMREMYKLDIKCATQ